MILYIVRQIALTLYLLEESIMFKNENLFDVKLGDNRRKCSCCGSKEEMMIKRMNHEFAGIQYGYYRKIFDNELEIERLEFEKYTRLDPNFFDKNNNKEYKDEIKNQIEMIIKRIKELEFENKNLDYSIKKLEQRHKQRIKQIGGIENE